MPPLNLADVRHALVRDLDGRYAIDVDLLGYGGMAVVIGATDLGNDRRVAIKVMHPDQAVEFGADRFLREINLTAGLRHPRILPLLDSGSVRHADVSVPFYVMPLVIGQSLRSRLDVEGRLPTDDALGIARDVADGLEYAHERGVIHRDIKPDNVLLNESGVALIADFGVALACGIEDAPRLTLAGTSVGSPNYMSPEQLFGNAPVGPCSDQYSLAATIFEMLVGRPPHDAPSRWALIQKRATEPPEPLRDARPDLPEGFADALARGMAHDPALRHGSVSAFVASLERKREENHA